jgi:hypothetical protein
VPDDDGGDPLYQATQAVEHEVRLAAEMAEWEAATVGEGMIAAPDISAAVAQER